jgi:hypothetical protein
MFDAAVVMQEARPGALGHVLELGNLIAPPANVQQCEASEVDRCFGTMRFLPGKRGQMSFNKVEFLTARFIFLPTRLQCTLFLLEARGKFARAQLAAFATRSFSGELSVEVLKKGFDATSIILLVKRFGPHRSLAGLLRQHLIQAANCLIAPSEAFMQLALLAIHLSRKRRVVLLQLPQAPNVGAVCRSHQMREHVHVAENPLDDVFCCQGMREYGPVCSGDVALLEGVTPKRKETGRLLYTGISDNRGAMPSIQRFLKEPGAALAPACQHHPLLCNS